METLYASVAIALFPIILRPVVHSVRLKTPYVPPDRARTPVTNAMWLLDTYAVLHLIILPSLAFVYARQAGGRLLIAGALLVIGARLFLMFGPKIGVPYGYLLNLGGAEGGLNVRRGVYAYRGTNGVVAGYGGLVWVSSYLASGLFAYWLWTQGQALPGLVLNLIGYFVVLALGTALTRPDSELPSKTKS